MITLTLKEEPTVPLEAESISPDVTAYLKHDALRALPVLLGKRQRRLEDFFEIEGEASDDLVIRGDLTRVKWIGRGMTRGRVTITGNVGMHLGASMKGGVIDVTGTDVAPGDLVVIVGEQGTESLGVREIAAAIGTIPYDLLCRVGARIHRVFNDTAP